MNVLYITRQQKDKIKVGIFWGGGLGDLLVLRPLVKGFKALQNVQLYFFTTADHLPGLAQQILGDIECIKLSHAPASILKTIRKYQGYFDVIYLGPYPTFKTRVLAYLFRPTSIWSKIHKKIPSYMLEQILEDRAAMGLPGQQKEGLNNLLPWSPTAQKTAEKKYLVIHPGSKEKWQTTRWSSKNWADLIEQIIAKHDCNIIIAGTKSESVLVSSITEKITADNKSAVTPSLSLPLDELSALIAASQGVICHNSGILHLSTMLGKQTVAITGSSAKYWQPSYPWVKNVTSGLCSFSCNCYKCPVPLFKAKCISKLTVEKVLQTVESHIFASKRETDLQIIPVSQHKYIQQNRKDPTNQNLSDSHLSAILLLK